MRYAVAFAALLLAACAPLWMDPIRQTGANPDTYEIVHTMGTFSPTKGVRQGVIDRATAKCTATGKTYTKLREELAPGSSLSYTLVFQCLPTPRPANIK